MHALDNIPEKRYNNDDIKGFPATDGPWSTTRKREMIKPTVWAILSSPRDRIALFVFYLSTKGNIKNEKNCYYHGFG